MPTIISKPQVVLRNGRPQAVVLDIKDYQRLLEVAEEKEDLAELQRIKRNRTFFRELKDCLRQNI